MAKPNFKDILLAKGEKIGLIAGGAIAALFAVLGVMSIASADSPTDKAKKFDSEASRINSGVNALGEAAPPLPQWVDKAGNPVPIPANQFALAGPPFEPLYSPDPRRQNPKVLPIVGYQIDLLRVPMRALDIHETSDGILVGARVDKPVSEKDRKNVADSSKNALNTLFNTKGMKPKSARPQNRPPGFQQPGGAPGGAPPSGPGGPTGGGQPPRGGAGFPGAGGAGFPGGGENPYGSFMGGQAGLRDDKAVAYLTPQEIQEKGLPLAETVYPARMLLVHALFPLKEQLEEIKTALRLDTIQQAIAESSDRGQPGPVFDGFEVQRQTTFPDGTKSEWAQYDHEYEYASKIRTRMWASQPDTGFLTYFLRPYQQKLAAPLPQLADQLGTYPNLRIPQILEAEKKMREAGKQPITPTEWEERFKVKPGGEFNPYAPLGAAGYGAGAGASGAAMPGGAVPPRGGSAAPPGGQFPPGSAAPPGGAIPPGASAQAPGSFSSPGGDPTRPGVTGTLQSTTGPESDYLLLRFIDPDVLPGHAYQYRIRVKMKNPNYKKPTLVARPDDAGVETLTGMWASLGEVVRVPAESYLFAGDPAKYVEHVDALADRYGKEPALKNLMDERAVQEGRKAVVQVQQWTQQIRLDSGTKTEPVGTWVVSDLAVSPGEYIGKRQLVELPLWSAGLGNYVLRELTSGVKVWGVRDQRNQPKGWPVNFKTLSVLVDFDGGKVKTRVNDREVTDDANTELLILRPDGKMLVRNSAADAEDEARKERTAKWDDWLKRVRERKGTATAGNPSDPNFGRPGGSSPGGAMP